MTFTDKQLELLEFVKECHGEQKRKYTGDPYWVHVVCVANIIQQHNINDGVSVEVALCHDLLEDTTCNSDELHKMLERIGYDHEVIIAIIDGVESLTDVYSSQEHPTMNRKVRKAHEAIRLGRIKPEWQTIKYADLIDNTSSIVDYDPGFAKKYLQEKLDILDNMRAGNIHLLIECCATFKKACDKLKMKL